MFRNLMINTVAVLALGSLAGGALAQSTEGGLEAELKLMRVQLAQIQLDMATERKKATELRRELDDLKTFFKSDDHIQEFREWQAARAKLAEETTALQQERARLEQARVDLIRTARSETEKQELADRQKADQERREQRAEDRQRRSEEQQRIDELNEREVNRARYLERIYPYGLYYPQAYYPSTTGYGRHIDNRNSRGHGSVQGSAGISTGVISGSFGSSGSGGSVSGGIIPLNRLPAGTVAPRVRAQHRTPALMGGNPIYPWAGSR